MKLQINVSDKFAADLEVALVKASLAKSPDAKPPKTGALIPTALLDYAESQGALFAPEIRQEANDVLTRKPGPQKKKPLVSRDLFDPRPGVWYGKVAIEAGFMIVRCDEQELQLGFCTIHEAAFRAALEGWGAIPEAKPESNDPNAPTTPGMRFIPPGASLLPKEPPKHAPLTIASVGTWISEDSIAQKGFLILANGRVVDFLASQEVPPNAFVIPCAVLGAKAHYLPDWSDAQKKAHDEAYEDAKKRAVLESIMFAQAEAYELGWTCKRETRKGKVGVLFIPPKVRLTYEIGPGQTVAV